MMTLSAIRNKDCNHSGIAFSVVMTCDYTSSDLKQIRELFTESEDYSYLNSSQSTSEDNLLSYDYYGGR